MVEVTKSYHAAIFRVEGKVQGVGYRYFVLRRAGDLDLVGSVRNLPDDAVEVRAGGTASQLAMLRRLLERGPAAARVSGVSTKALDPAPRWQRFEITYF